MKYNKIKTIVISVLVVGLLILSLTICAYYRSSLIDINKAIAPEAFAAFGSFIGSLIGLLFSGTSMLLIYFTYKSQQEQLILTTNLIDRQISLSIKPEIVLEKYENLNAESLTTNLEKHLINNLLPAGLKFIKLKLLNVGIEVAQNIEYSFEYNLNQLNDYLNRYIKEPQLKCEIKENFIRFHQLRTNEKRNDFIREQVGKEDHLIPFKINRDYLTIVFPWKYLTYYYFILFGDRNEEYIGLDKPKPEIPKCYLNICYTNLEGITYNKKFKFSIGIASVSNGPYYLANAKAEVIITTL